jgi:hypothetical protein
MFLKMSTVESIKQAIQLLSVEERAEIIADLCGWTDDDWDRQMKADADAGKFDFLNRQAETCCILAARTPGQVKCGMSQSFPRSGRIRKPRNSQI